MEPNYSWIYLLIFLMIPLARVLPRILRRAGLKPNIATRPETPRGNFFKEPPSDNFTESPTREEYSTKNWSKEKIVLGLLMTNISKFEELSFILVILTTILNFNHTKLSTKFSKKKFTATLVNREIILCFTQNTLSLYYYSYIVLCD